MNARTLTVLLGLLTGGCAFAHETWLQPATFQSVTAAPVLFDLTSGQSFPTLEHAIAPDRIAKTGFRLNGVEAPFHSMVRGAKSLQFLQNFDQPGIATAWATLQPRPLELSSGKVRLYFSEINAGPEIRERWRRMQGRQAWREIYTKHAKTCLRVGDGTDDHSWSKPVGMELEIVPVTNPLQATARGRMSFRLLHRGTPVANAPLGLIVGGGKRSFQTTDAQGTATFVSENPGPALVFAVRLEFQEETKTWRSDFTTFTMSILKRP